MFNKWVVTLTLTLALLSGVATSAETDVLVSHTKNIKHSHGGGGRGLDKLELIAPETESNSCPIFNSAEIKYSMRRYGGAKIISQPLLQCDPRNKERCTVSISWKHSPAGRLNYKIRVGWTLKPC